MTQPMTAVVVLRPEEGKCLIGRAVAELPQVKKRVQAGCMVIVGSTTNRYVVRHLLGEDPGRETFPVGCIRHGKLGETPKEQRGPGPYLFEDGQITRGWPGALLERFAAGDIYIKGANAIDAQGNAGILLSSPTGGSMGAALSIIAARGGELIVPVSLEKLIPSIPAVAPLLGQGRVDRVMGSPVGFMPIMAGFARVVTEIQAIALLADVAATAVAAGGMDDCAGAITLHLRGTENAVEKIWNIIQDIRYDYESTNRP